MILLLLLLLNVQAASAQKRIIEYSWLLIHGHPFQSFSFSGSQFRFLRYVRVMLKPTFALCKAL